MAGAPFRFEYFDRRRTRRSAPARRADRRASGRGAGNVWLLGGVERERGLREHRAPRRAGRGARRSIRDTNGRESAPHAPRAPRSAARFLPFGDFVAILESRSWTRTTFLVAFGSGFVQSANPRSRRRSPTKAGYLFFLNKANMGYIPATWTNLIYDRSFGRRIARRVRRAWSIAIRPSVSSSPWTSGGPPAL
jgi:hypothetical protein